MTRDIGITYWPIGDSITFGYDVAAPTVPMVGRYADLVRDKLAASRRVFYKNEGHSGWTSGQILPIVRSSARNMDADVITILIGTNDASGAVDQNTYKSNLISIIQAIKNAKTMGQCEIFLCTLTSRFDGVNLAPYNQTIQTVATEQKVKLIDLSAVISDATYTQDNLHPTVAGQQLMTDAIWASIQNGGWKQNQKRPNVWFGHNLKALANYRTALSNVQNQMVKVYCIGDSITRGEYSSIESSKSWVGQLRSLLQAKYGSAPGEGFINSYEAGLPAGAKSRWTTGTGWAAPSFAGFGGVFVNTTSATVVTPASVTFTGTSVTLLYSRATDGGAANVTVDGAAQGSINCLGGTNFTQSLQITGLTNGSHTLTVTPTGNGKVFIEGIIVNSTATSGIQVNRMGISTRKASDWNSAYNFQRWATLPPNLVIFALGMNECYVANNIPIATYKSNLGALISNFQSYGSSVLLLVYPKPDASWTTRYEEYVQAQYELADQYNVGLVNLYKATNKSYEEAQAKGIFGLTTNDFSGTSGTNNAHPSDKGYNYISQVMYPHLIL